MPDFIPATRDDLKPGAVFVVHQPRGYSPHPGFEAGTRVVLSWDDGTTTPEFRRADDRGTCCLDLSRLSVATPTFKVGDRVRIRPEHLHLYADYRSAPAEVIDVDFNSIRIRYDDTTRTSWCDAKYLEAIPVPTPADDTVTIPKKVAAAFVAAHTGAGYGRGNYVRTRADLRTAILAACPTILEPADVIAARATLESAGYTVTKAA